jgi:transcriptional regulator with PAS, ATPase and Fis domain
VPADVNSILDKRSTKLSKLGSSIPIKSVETIRKVSDYVARSCSKCIGVSDYKGLSLKEIKRINSAKTDQYIIEAVLRDTGNNKAEAARRLHIDYKSLCSKVKKIIKPEGK